MRTAAEEDIPGGVFASDFHSRHGYLSFVRVNVHAEVEFAGNKTRASKMLTNKSLKLDSSSAADPRPMMTFKSNLQSPQHLNPYSSGPFHNLNSDL